MWNASGKAESSGPPPSRPAEADHASEDDRLQIERVLAGETDAFAPLIEKYRRQVFRIVASMVAAKDIEEVGHEVFIRAFKDLGGYSGRAPFGHWLSKVTVRTCYDFWRKMRRERHVAVSAEHFAVLESELLAETRIDASAVERAEDLVEWALGHLKPQDRAAFSLLYIEEMSMKEVAEAMGWSVAQVKMRSFRARHLLRRLLATRGGK